MIRTVVAGALIAIAMGGAWAESLDAIRTRLRAEAGVCETSRDDRDLPMVGLVVLPGDTHDRLARDLTGQPETAGVLRKVAPRLRPGERVFVPRALLSPLLADPRLDVLRLDETLPTLWRLVRTRVDTSEGGTAVAVRNLQRLNGITDPTRLPRGARILVPRSLLKGREAGPAPPLRLSRRYRVKDVSGLGRTPKASQFPAALRRRLRGRRVWKRQLLPRKPDLVVIHTTEHGGAPFENVAAYIRRKRLANYLIGPDGTVYEIVPDRYRAHGCGQSLWEGRYEVDFNAINVEVYADTRAGDDIRPAQYEALRALLATLRGRYPGLHEGRVVTHRMVALNYATGMRARKGDPYRFDWAQAGLPDNSQMIDQDVLVGRAKPCYDPRYADRVTEGQEAAARMGEL
ncbi:MULTISPECIES: N-acetylmuramoyl-L-alanine amidase [Deferrisoma]